MVHRFAPVLVVLTLLVSGCASVPTLQPAAAVSAELGRDEAIAQLAAETFLPIDKASCVIDAVYFASGTYNPKSAAALAAVDQSQLVADCTQVDAGFTLPERDEDAALAPVEELEVETGAIEIAERFILSEATMPAINPGGVATGRIDIGDKSIDYVTITPPGFVIGDSAPVFFALPPGGQDLEITHAVATGVYAQQALARGWVVVSPAAPGGVWYDADNAAVVPEFVSWMRAWVTIEGGKPHLGGMSNGGLSAFHLAIANPDAYQSLLAFPGYPPSERDSTKLELLATMPVYMWVGGEDTSWVQAMEATAAELRVYGGEVQLNVLPGEPHVLQSITNGVSIFDALNASR